MTEAQANRIIAEALLEQRKIGLAEMTWAIGCEAAEIESEQRVRLMGEMILKPMPRQIERIQNLDAVHRHLSMCNADPYRVIKWLNSIKDSRK